MEFLADGWRRAGNAVETLVVAGANHIDILTDALIVPGAPLHTAVLRQMGL